MAISARDIIKGSMKLIGVLAQGENPDASQAADGLSSLNRMLDRWSTESLSVYQVVRDELALTPSTGEYTLGATGMLDTARPVKVLNAAIKMNDSESTISVINVDHWSAISQKSSQGLPSKLFLSGTFPLDTAYLYPVPNVACSLVLYSQKTFAKFTSVNTEVELPPGYEDAIIYNLALRLCPEYGIEPQAAVVIEATEAKAAIKRQNIRPSYLGVDPALVINRPFDILKGS